mgnify:CR=1 FL=1
MNETKTVGLEEEMMNIKSVRVPSSPQDVHPNKPGDAQVHLETQNLHVWFGKRLILEKVNLATYFGEALSILWINRLADVERQLESILRDIINKEVIDKIDHCNINLDVDFMKGKLASTEVLAVEIWNQLLPHIEKDGVKLHAVKLYETENNFVEYYG